jgi:hypothetical protein
MNPYLLIALMLVLAPCVWWIIGVLCRRYPVLWPAATDWIAEYEKQFPNLCGYCGFFRHMRAHGHHTGPTPLHVPCKEARIQ